jgi:hypothetical protein
MSESADFDPGPWKGHDFRDAYDHYDTHVGRSYSDPPAASRHSRRASVSSSSVPSTPKKTLEDVREALVSSNCRNPLVIFCDVTGSMKDWPRIIFSKLPYLDLEGKEYLGEDMEIAFGAVGDVFSDEYPLQIRAFGSGPVLKDRILELEPEGGGGGTMSESYDVAALYALHNINIPKAVKPIIIFIGDEKPYDEVAVDTAASYAGVTLQRQILTEKIFDQLKKKFSVYLIRKPYGSSDGNSRSASDEEIHARWLGLLGADHICDLPVPERVVDVIFGILARETGRIEYFKEEIEGRQKEDQVATVYKSLASIHTDVGSARKGARSMGQSIMKIEHKGPHTKSLLDD